MCLLNLASLVVLLLHCLDGNWEPLLDVWDIKKVCCHDSVCNVVYYLSKGGHVHTWVHMLDGLLVDWLVVAGNFLCWFDCWFVSRIIQKFHQSGLFPEQNPLPVGLDQDRGMDLTLWRETPDGTEVVEWCDRNMTSVDVTRMVEVQQFEIAVLSVSPSTVYDVITPTLVTCDLRPLRWRCIKNQHGGWRIFLNEQEDFVKPFQ